MRIAAMLQPASYNPVVPSFALLSQIGEQVAQQLQVGFEKPAGYRSVDKGKCVVEGRRTIAGPGVKRALFVGHEKDWLDLRVRDIFSLVYAGLLPDATPEARSPTYSEQK